MLPTEIWEQICQHLSPTEFTQLLLSSKKIYPFQQRITLQTKKQFHSPALLIPSAFTDDAFDYILQTNSFEFCYYARYMSRISPLVAAKGFVILAKSICKDRHALRVLYPFIDPYDENQLALRAFIELGDVEMVQQLMAQPKTNLKQAHALVLATKHNHFELVRMLVDYDPDPNAFLFACQLGHSKIVSYLVPRIDYTFNQGRGFVLACLFNQIKVVRILLRWEYFESESMIISGLNNGCYYGYKDLVRLLLEKHTPDKHSLCQMLDNCSHTEIKTILEGLL